MKEIQVVCGKLEVDNSDISKFERGKAKIGADVSVKIETDRVDWREYANSPRNREVEVGFSELPLSLRGIITRRER